MRLLKTSFYLAAPLIAGFFLIGAGEPYENIDPDDPLVAEGKLLFEETAGNVGCAACHGIDATGDPDVGAPYIIGVSAAQMDAALKGGVPDMDFFNLNRKETKALLAYLNALHIVEEEPVPPQGAKEEAASEETDTNM